MVVQNTAVAEFDKATYYSIGNGRMIFVGRKLGKHLQSAALVSSKSLWFELRSASRVAGMGVSLLLDVDYSFRCAFFGAGHHRPAVYAGHRYAREFACP